MVKTTAAGKKKWTFMVYMAGDNNLDANGIQDLNEMKKVGTTTHINVVAEFDRARQNQQTNRYLLKKGTTLESDVVQSLGEVDTGAPRFLIDFVQWAAQEYPADRYLLVLWNHGQGWDDTDIYARERTAGARLPRTQRIRHALFRSSVEETAKLRAAGGVVARAILLDDNAKDFLDNVEMKKAGQQIQQLLGHKLDLLGMDACLMSMAEVVYQMRDSVSCVVGSEQTEPLDGWPYDPILSGLAKQPALTAEALGKLIVEQYVKSYKGSGEAVTQSASTLAGAARLAGAVKALGTALKASLTNSAAHTAITLARSRVQEYDVPDNVDLVDLCNLLKKSSVPAAVKTACDQALSAVQAPSGMVLNSSHLGAPMKNSNGLAIYFPTRQVSPLYARLDFTKYTGWGAFLKAYIAATRSR
jgi:hypothetical protein